MRRNVQEAIRQVRESITASKRARLHVGTAWSVAETLADEVERLHKRLEEAERVASPVKRDAYFDEQVLMHIATHPRRCVSMGDLERHPPRGMCADDARATAQRLVSRGELHVDRDMKFRCGSGVRP